MKRLIIKDSAHRLTIKDNALRLTMRSNSLRLTMSKQGPAGAPGTSAEAETYTAAATLGGHRAVALDETGEIIYASSSLSIPAIGVIRDAVTAGGEVTVYRAGRVTGFTGLTPAATYYLAATGLLSLTPPTSGVLQPLGVAASATELLVDPDYPTFL
jgi:hypothetical protein